MASRIPLSLDLSYYIILGCALGLGEASVVIASVAHLPFRLSFGSIKDNNSDKESSANASNTNTLSKSKNKEEDGVDNNNNNNSNKENSSVGMPSGTHAQVQAVR